MYQCRVDFANGLVYIGPTVLDKYTDETFVARIFTQLEHQHDLIGTPIYTGEVSLTIDDCNFNRVLITFHRPRNNLPPVIKNIIFLLDRRPDWTHNELFHMVQRKTNGPAVRPGSTYSVKLDHWEVIASDAIAGREACLKLRFDNAVYSDARKMSENETAMRSGVIRLGGHPIRPDITRARFVELMRRSRARNIRGSLEMAFNDIVLSGDFAMDGVEGSVDVSFTKEGTLHQILFRGYLFDGCHSKDCILWLRRHFGDTSGDMIVHTATHRVCFSPHAAGLKITYYPKE